MKLSITPIINQQKQKNKQLSEQLPRPLNLLILHYKKEKNQQSYIKNTLKLIKDLNIKATIRDISQPKLNNKYTIKELVQDKHNLVDAIMPVNNFPTDIKEIIKQNINISKDIDNFSGKSNFKHCTIEAVEEIFKYYNISTNQFICCLGRNLGGEMADYFRTKPHNATPIVVHSKTKYKDYQRAMDISNVVISCIGKKDMILTKNTHYGQFIIDVGRGDVSKELYNLENIRVTPKNEGVGILTTLKLIEHILKEGVSKR